MLEFGHTWKYVMFAAAAIYVPAWGISKMNGDEQS